MRLGNEPKDDDVGVWQERQRMLGLCHFAQQGFHGNKVTSPVVQQTLTTLPPGWTCT